MIRKQSQLICYKEFINRQLGKVERVPSTLGNVSMTPNVPIKIVSRNASA